MLLTIIVPFYKGKNYVGSLYDSLKGIEHDFELLFVVDGSPDDSYSFLINKFSFDSRVRVFYKKNGGVSETRNFGIEKANGDFLLFVDQDDVVCSETIDKAIDLLECHNSDACFWSTKKRYSNGKVDDCCIIKNDLTINKNTITSSLISSMIWDDSNEYLTYLGHVWGGLYKKEIVLKHDISFHSFINYDDDFIFVYNYLKYSNNIVLIKDVGYYWMQYESSASHSNIGVIDYVAKAFNFYSYFDDFFSEAEKTKYKVFSFQNIAVKAVCNYGKIHLDKEREKERVLLFLKRKEVKDAFKTNKLMRNDWKLFNIIFSLIKAGLFRFALFVSRFYFFVH